MLHPTHGSKLPDGSTPNNSRTASALPNDGGKSILICLMRLDLRITDNPLFYYAHQAPKPILSSAEKTVDLSKLDDEALLGSTSDFLLPIYVFDEREIELSGLPGYKRKGPEARTKEYGFWKTGGFRTRFISESVYDLRSRLRAVGSDLMIRFGIPEDVIRHLVQGFQANGDHVEGIWMQKEMTYPDTEVENLVAKKLHGTGVPVHFLHGKTLLHPSDMPFSSSETPDVFTPFRKKVETLGSKMVRTCKHPPTKFKPFPPDIPEIPDYALDVSYEVDVDGFAARAPESSDKQEGQVSFHDILRFLLTPLNESNLPATLEANALLQQRHPASAFPFRGGETAALDRLEWYFVRGKSADSSRYGKVDPPPAARYKQTRNNLLGHGYSTKMSPFLANGCISPRQIWEALDAHEKKFGEDQNTYWVRFEMLWRDYFFFVAEKFGTLLYDIGGFEKATDPRQASKKTEDGWWRKWDPVKDGPEHEMTRLLEGRTGIPFIDANILELRESGFMSNRGRQNVASFLSKDLGYDWRIGAEFFQSHLIDYDATSNYGNWQYVAGVGNDPRASRQFNIIKQAKDYDSHGEYVKMWIPALRNLHADFVHTPWLLDPEERRSYGLKATKMDVSMDGYPEKPLFEDPGWQRHYERKQGVGSKMHGNPQEKVKDGKLVRRNRPSAGTRPFNGSGGNTHLISESGKNRDPLSASSGGMANHPSAYRFKQTGLRATATTNPPPQFSHRPQQAPSQAIPTHLPSSLPKNPTLVNLLAPVARAAGNALDFGGARSSSSSSNDSGRLQRSTFTNETGDGKMTKPYSTMANVKPASNARLLTGFKNGNGANGGGNLSNGSLGGNGTNSQQPSRADLESSWRKGSRD